MKNIRFSHLFSVIIVLTAATLIFSFPLKKDRSPAPISAQSELYLGQPLPDNTPRLFAPNLISDGMYNRDASMTADGSEMYFGLAGRGFSHIIWSRIVNGQWSKPAMAPFSGSRTWYDFEPHVSPDGKHFYFLSTRPQKNQEAKPGWVYQDIWAMDRIEGTDKGWGKPYNLGPPVNSAAPEFFPSMTLDGTLYFTREGEGRESSIWRAKKTDTGFEKAEKLPKIINGGGTLYNACIAPDESVLIVCAAGRDDAIGTSDYYASFRKDDDTWSELINLGEPFNLPGSGGLSPYITPDGKYFFFSSNRTAPESEDGHRSLKEIRQRHTLPGNGQSDIYWVSTDFLKALRKRVL